MEKKSFFKKNSHFAIFNIDDYSMANETFIKNKCIILKKIEKIVKELEENQSNYHFRIHNNENYIFFGDIDYYEKNISEFKDLLFGFLFKYYKINSDNLDFFYTQNSVDKRSYHYSIPKLNASTEKLKEILSNFLKKYEIYLTSEEKGLIKKNVDTTIYSEHWFRCPNQLKGKSNGKRKDDNIHKIINGNMIDFIVDYIPEDSINIDDYIFFDDIQEKKDIPFKIIKKKNDEQIVIKNKEELVIDHNDNCFSGVVSQPTLYKKMFDECYKKERFEMYEYWYRVGMAIRNTFNDDNIAFELFDYYSSKGNNYEGSEVTLVKFKTFREKIDGGITAKTIYFYAIEDNKPKFVEIMNQNTLDLEQSDICKYIKVLAGYKFVYKKNSSQYILYCYNGKFWENDDILLRSFISNELFDFLKNILMEVYWDNKNFNKFKTQLNKLKNYKFKDDIVKSYRECGMDNKIQFDEKWHLLCFDNTVYDLEEETFREYKYDDYVSMTTGYDWREPTNEEIITINKLIETIMPIKEERELYLQILASSLNGKCLENFIIFNGNGGNGKGMMNDIMLLALGKYGFIGNNSILFETNKTGSNPEKANIHKKRFVVFREPPAKNKFQNSVIKELTGGGKFSARGHHESDTQKELNLTMVVECNKRPLFAEEPEQADARRIIDLLFRSSFTNDESLLDAEKYIYMANSYYKTQEFQQKHKYALLYILIEEHKKLKKNNYKLVMPKTINDRTQTYLELSCNIVQWFKDTYEFTDDSKKISKIKDVYDKFTQSDYFSNLSKADKRKYSKSYFTDYIQNNIFFKKYYVERTATVKNFIKNWIIKIGNDEREDNDKNHNFEEN
jgi:phage/plasmid-associated DNA primase